MAEDTVQNNIQKNISVWRAIQLTAWNAGDAEGATEAEAEIDILLDALFDLLQPA
jgi:hypothetical protein